MGLSASTLFHFTSKEEYLLSILQNGFLSKYCLEDYSYMFPDGRRNKDALLPLEMAVPMTCFCDIKLSQTEEHALQYGKYIIGLTKEWGEKNGVTPVLYFHSNSLNPSLYVNVYHGIGDLVRALTGKTYEELGKDNSDLTGLPETLSGFYGALSAMTHYMKPINGEMFRDGKYVKKYFYDEREWRFIPRMVGHGVGKLYKFFLWVEEFHDKVVKQHEEERLHQHHRLLFNEDDIRYLVIPHTNEIEAFQEALKNGVNRLKAEKLFNKIRSYEDIKYDY